MKYVPGGGQLGAKIMIVGEAPSYVEEELGQPFKGPAGRELDKLLKDAGIRRNECWITNACKYAVPPAPKDKKIPFKTRAESVGINLLEQWDELQKEVNAIKPNVILSLGGTALWALTGKTKIQDYRGSIMMGMGRKLVPTYHPAHLLHQAGGEFTGYWNRHLMVFDMVRALRQSFFPEIELPRRNLQICRNSMHLYEFLRRYEHATKLSVDIEASDCVPSCVGLAFNKSHGISIPLWRSISDSDLVSVWIMLAKVLVDRRYKIIGQNFKYDEDKLKHIGFVIWKLWSDTMLKAFAINPELPKSLAFNTSIYTEEPFYKHEGMYEGSFDDLQIGNARDACVTYEVDENMDPDLDELGMRPFYENFLMELHPLYLEIESEGFRINTAKQAELLKKYIEWDEINTYKLFQMVGAEVNPASPKQVALLLYENWKLPYKKSTGEEDLTELLLAKKVSEEQKAVITLILETRRVRKTVSTYLMALPDYDGKMKTTCYLCLETGRTGTGQLDPPIRPKVEVIDIDGKKKKKNIGTAFQTLTKHGDIGSDIRDQYEAEPGWVFIQGDSEQAEARVVFLLANDLQALEDIDTHDYHALTASWFFGGTEYDYSKKVLGYESPIRFAGKTLRHACHLDAKGKRAATEVNTQARKAKIDINISEETANAAIAVFHRKQPKIRNNFHNGIIEALNKDKRILTAGLPFGIDAPHGGKRIFYERWGDELNRQSYSYIPQRSVSDNTKMAALRIKKRRPDARIILESHDALLLMQRESEANDWAQIIQEEMSRPISFEACSLPRRDLVIPCAIEIGYNYGELKKFKFEPEEVSKVLQTQL